VPALAVAAGVAGGDDAGGVAAIGPQADAAMTNDAMRPKERTTRSSYEASMRNL
jgi:hypothetical protein